MELSAIGAVVLSGGSAVRLDGADKAGLEIAGKTLLEHVLDSVEDVPDVVVVGEEVPTSRPVSFRREEPAGGGPVAALAAGMTGFMRTPPWVLLLAVDMPLVSANTISRLIRGTGDAVTPEPVDGALLVDAGGRRQYLCGLYDTAALLRAMPTDPRGAPMHRLLSRLALVEVPAIGSEAHDVDTWDDVREVREMLAPPDDSTKTGRREPPRLD